MSTVTRPLQSTGRRFAAARLLGRLPAPIQFAIKFAGMLLAIVLVVGGMAGLLRSGVHSDPAGREVDEATVAKYEQLRSPTLDLANAPVPWVDVDYSRGEKAAWYPKGESPILHELVEQGKLPPVAERVGPEPVVCRGVAGIGNYGGDLYQVVNDVDGVRLALQYVMINNTFTRFAPYGQPTLPHLARKIEASDDYTVWTVHLRRGVKWSDGHPFTADDIMFWWHHVAKDPEIGGIPVVARINGQPGEIEKLGDHKLRYTFPEPNPQWIADQAGVHGRLYLGGPAHYVRQFHPKLGDQELIKQLCSQLMISPNQLFRQRSNVLNPERPSLAPWVLRTSKSNGPWTVVRNPYYYAVDEEGNQLPYIDRVVFRQINPQLQPKAIMDGVPSIHTLIGGQWDYSSLMAQREAGGYEVRHWYPKRRSRLVIYPNRNAPVDESDPASAERAALLQTPNFRRAMSVAIDRQRIIDAAFKGIGEPEQLGPGPDEPWYDPDYGRINAQYDPALANRLLDELGLTERDASGYRKLPSGQRLTMMMICRAGETDALQFVVDDWQAVGLRVILEEKPHRLFQNQVNLVSLSTGDSTAADTWEALGVGRPYNLWYYAGGMYNSEESQKPIGLRPNATEIEVMRLGQSAAQAIDPAERVRLARQVMDIAAEQVWTISLATPGPIPAMVKDGLMGVPEMLKADWTYGTPNNGLMETWYWQEPERVNGEAVASDGYLAERQANITYEILHTTVAPEATIAPDGAAPGPSSLGKVLQYTLIGIGAVLMVLLVLRHPFVLRRLFIMVPTLAIISIIVFSAIQLPPGSYLDTEIEYLKLTGQQSQVQTRVAELTEMYHLDDGPVVNYFRWTGLLWFTTGADADKGLLQGNLGRSMSNNGEFVSTLMGDRLVLTMLISAGSILLTWIIALPIGIYSAVRQYSIADYGFTIIGFVGMCVPNFILALVLMLLARVYFGVTINGLFSSQYATQDYWDWAKVQDLLLHLWVPVIVVGAASTAGMIRVMRANLLDELRKPYVVTARAKGVPPIRLLMKYPLRLALNPFVAGIGGIFPALVSGSAIVAIILSLPTVGPLLLNAVMLEDTYMASSLLLCLSALSVFGVLVSDLLLMALDPRIRMGGGTR